MSKQENYIKYDIDLYDKDIPLVFTDGTDIYNELKKEYITHSKGYFIYGPSGVGKTYYINNQKEKNWIDGDILWMATKALPDGDWWNLSGFEIDFIEKRTDVITEQAKKLGFWILGSSSVNVVPDAIVMPDLDEHIKYIEYRENNDYDGGLKSDDIQKIKRNRDHFLRFEKLGVPVFKSVSDACAYLESQVDS